MTGGGLGPAAIQEFGKSCIFTNGDSEAMLAARTVSDAPCVRAFQRAGFRIVITLQARLVVPGDRMSE